MYRKHFAFLFVFYYFLNVLFIQAIKSCGMHKNRLSLQKKKEGHMFAAFNLQQMISAFIVLFAVIDIIGSIPIIINLKEKGKEVNALKATLISLHC